MSSPENAAIGVIPIENSAAYQRKIAETATTASAMFSIANPGPHHINDSAEALIDLALARKEGRLAASGVFVTETGQHTGRSAADKFVVRDDATEHTIWWSNSKPITPDQFATLLQDFRTHAEGRELFMQDLFAGADPAHRLPVRIYAERAWHALFIRHLLIVPKDGERESFAPELTIVDMPSFKADSARHGVRSETVIAVDFARQLVLIGGTSYAGEIKKSIFTYLNYVLPERGVMPMHCSVNEEWGGGNAAVFFGLSGTGKTTLSADAARTLVGDDEHGWSESGVFNFEGGCYAKTIRLSRDAEPQIYEAVTRAGAVLENVILREDGCPDFDDGSLTENTRGAYPLDFIANSSATGLTGHPKNIVMLTADAFGVLPPIAKLDPHQAIYHFLSGYTARVAGTEKGVTEPSATFSACFGAPFMPRHPGVYGDLLRKMIAEHEVDCWLVNTGWTGGKYGTGRRMPIKATRALLLSALSGGLGDVEMRTDPLFGFQVPKTAPGVDDALLDPRSTWLNPKAYDGQAQALVEMFAKNFTKFASGVDEHVRSAGPALRRAAE